MVAATTRIVSMPRRKVDVQMPRDPWVWRKDWGHAVRHGTSKPALSIRTAKGVPYIAVATLRKSEEDQPGSAVVVLRGVPIRRYRRKNPRAPGCLICSGDTIAERGSNQ